MRCNPHLSIHDRPGAKGTAILLVALLTIAMAPQSALAQAEDDLFLFTTSVPPNVMILLDNSGSMNHIVWHPAFDPAKTYDCSDFTGELTYYLSSSGNATYCGVTRKLHHDSSSVGSTRYDGRYLNWYFSSANTYMTEINASNNGTRACKSVGSPTYAKYQRNRMSAAKQVVLDTICKVELTKSVRFGLAVYRDIVEDNDPTAAMSRSPSKTTPRRTRTISRRASRTPAPSRGRRSANHSSRSTRTS